MPSGRVARDLAEHDHPLLWQLDGGDAVGRFAHGRRRRVVVVDRVGPDAPASAELHLLELGARARRVAAERRLLGKEIRPAGGAPRADEMRFALVEREPSFDRGRRHARGHSLRRRARLQPVLILTGIRYARPLLDLTFTPEEE